MAKQNFSYEGISVGCEPNRVTFGYGTAHWGISKQEAGFLELVVAGAQSERVSSRHASAPDECPDLK